ncbi:23213_t:CDS:1, partial [Gigaspora margarita]
MVVFNDSEQKKITNMWQNKDLEKADNSNLNNELINVDSTKGIEEQDQTTDKHIQDVQEQDQ